MEAVLKDCWLSHCWLRWQLWIQIVALWLRPGPDGPVLDLGCFSGGHHLAVAGWLWPHGQQQSGGDCLREPARCTRPLGPAGCRQGCTWENNVKFFVDPSSFSIWVTWSSRCEGHRTPSHDQRQKRDAPDRQKQTPKEANWHYKINAEKVEWMVQLDITQKVVTLKSGSQNRRSWLVMYLELSTRKE